MNELSVDKQEWLGCEFIARPDAQFLLDGRVIPHPVVDCPFTIMKVEGDRLWVGVAWINKEEVISVAEAPAFFSEYIRKHPRHAWGYLSRGLAWSALDNDDNAITDFTKALSLDPEYEIAYYDRGICWMDRGELDNAIRDFNEAIRLDPEYVRAWYNRGATWYQMGEVEQALTNFTEVIRLDPQHAAAFNDRGVIWNFKGEVDKAIQDFSKAIWLDPDYVYAFSNRGDVWNNTDAYSLAINDYSEAIRLDPKDEATCNSLAWLLATCPDAEFRDGTQAYILAEQLCESAAWEDADYLDTLAAAYAEAGDFQQAVKYQKLSIEILDEAVDRDVFKKRLARYREGQPYHTQPVGTEPK